jgi:hypothetical protein
MAPLRLTVRVTPRGGRDGVDGWITDDAGRTLLKVRVRAAPTDGEANAAVEAMLAKLLKISRSAVSVTAGHTARVKQIALDGVTAAELAQAFGPFPSL